MLDAIVAIKANPQRVQIFLKWYHHHSNSFNRNHIPKMFIWSQKLTCLWLITTQHVHNMATLAILMTLGTACLYAASCRLPSF